VKTSKTNESNSFHAATAVARDAFNALITSQENHVQSFQGYGSSFMKQSGYAPDAFVQMAMQLATYRLFGEQAGTYEATQVRPFLHGRTETTRTVSTASAAFIKKMGMFPKMDEADPGTRKEKLALLQEATRVHSEYTKTAAQAQGVDRHFLGLSLLLEEGETKPALYSDPVFIRSKTWRVSTSHLTHLRHASWGFGEVVPDGVGIGYAILPESCVFHVTARRERSWSDKLSELLEEALLEMKRVIEMDKASTSKL
jgi:carnitine O-acetyltransferase